MAAEKQKKKKKLSKAGRIILDVIMIAALCVAGYSGWKLYEGLHAYHEEDSIYEQIRRQSLNETSDEKDGSSEETKSYTRDWDALKAINPDTAGWISLADSTIDYPVTYAPDNEWYLYHLFDGTPNGGGAIFVDCSNSRGFTDRNTVIYGHHMYNDSMFNNVEKYRDPSWYETHKVLSLETPEGNYELHPVAGVLRKGTDSYVQTQFSSEEEYQAYVQNFVRDSTFQSDETVGEGDRTVLLSTCSFAIDDGRYALLCRLVPVENQNG